MGNELGTPYMHDRDHREDRLQDEFIAALVGMKDFNHFVQSRGPRLNLFEYVIQQFVEHDLHFLENQIMKIMTTWKQIYGQDSLLSRLHSLESKYARSCRQHELRALKYVRSKYFGRYRCGGIIMGGGCGYKQTYVQNLPSTSLESSISKSEDFTKDEVEEQTFDHESTPEDLSDKNSEGQFDKKKDSDQSSAEDKLPNTLSVVQDALPSNEAQLPAISSERSFSPSQASEFSKDRVNGSEQTFDQELQSALENLSDEKFEDPLAKKYHDLDQVSAEEQPPSILLVIPPERTFSWTKSKQAEASDQFGKKKDSDQSSAEDKLPNTLSVVQDARLSNEAQLSAISMENTFPPTNDISLPVKILDSQAYDSLKTTVSSDIKMAIQLRVKTNIDTTGKSAQTEISIVQAQVSGDQKYERSKTFAGWINIESTEIWYNLKKFLRKGSKVYEAKRKGKIEEDIVVKFITESGTDYFGNTAREVEHLIKAGASENVVKYFQSGECEFHNEKAVFIAMEKCDTKTLGERIEKENLPHEIRKKYVRDIAEGMRHLKGKNILHCDLKPHNILFRDGTAVLSDFGLSKKHSEKRSNTIQSKDNVGTDGWRAPETSRLTGKTETHENRRSITYDADTYSAGLLFFYILTNGGHPYGDCPEHRQTFIDRYIGQSLKAIYGTPDGAIAFDLIDSMLQRDPKERSSIEAVLKHPFFYDTKERLNFLSTAHKTVEFMDKLQKNTKLENTSFDLNFLKDIKYGEEVEKEIKNWPDKLLLNEDEIVMINLNFKQKGKTTEVDKEALKTKAFSKKRKILFEDSATELLRFMRNRDTHHHDDEVEESICLDRDQFLKLFSDRFPHFFIYIWRRFQDYYTGKQKSDKDYSTEMAKYFIKS